VADLLDVEETPGGLAPRLDGLGRSPVSTTTASRVMTASKMR
jgi:hypothetical protein